MGKKGLGIITSLLIAVIVGSWLFFQENSKYIGTSGYSAVPIESPLILEIRNVSSLTSELKQSKMWNELAMIPGGDIVYSDICFVDSLFQNIPLTTTLFNKKSMLVTVDCTEENKCSQLNIVELSDVSEKTQIMTLLRSLTRTDDLKLHRRKFHGSYLFDVSLTQPLERNFTFTIHHGLFMFSLNKTLVENAVTQLEQESLVQDTNFQKLYKTADKSADISCYINHNTFASLFSLPFTGLMANKLKQIDDYATWSELDLNFKEMSGIVSGFSFSEEEKSQLVDVFKGQTAKTFSSPNVIPSTVTFASLFQVNDIDKLESERTKYLTENNKLQAHLVVSKSITKQTNTDLFNLIRTHLDGEIGVFSAPPTNGTSSNFLLLKIKSQSSTKKYLSSFQDTNEIISYKIDNETEFPIYKFSVPNLAQLLLGEFYSEINSNYYTYYNNFLVFGNTQESLKEFLSQNVRGETMGKSKQFQSFLTNLSNKGVYLLYAKPAETLQLFHNSLEKSLVTKLQKQLESLKKFNTVGWLITPESNMLYNIGYFEFDPNNKLEPKTKWKSHLASAVQNKPQLVINHNDPKNKEVFLQDEKNVIHLINNQGREEWSIPLNETILGQIEQIDLYKNNKLQYLFNTKSAIHLIDRNGNYVKNFPIQLRAKATNPVAVFDYDNNKNYRFFVACSDQKVYAYDKNGRTVTGWRFGKSENKVTTQIKHFRIATKDYIVFHDRYKPYILDRKGNERVKSRGSFTFSNNPFALEAMGDGKSSHIIGSTEKGDVVQFFFDGTTKLIQLPNHKANHFFRSEDVNGDGKKDYVFLKNEILEVLQANGEKLISKRFKNKILDPPFLYRFSKNNIKIGVVDRKANEIHLINRNGTEYRGFPLSGNSPFSIGFINPKRTNFSLIVGGKNDFLYHYVLQ